MLFMKQIIMLLAVTLLLLVPSFAFSQEDHTIVGHWFSEDEEDSQNDGVIEVYRKENRYFGKLVWSRRDNPLDVEGDGKPLIGRDLLRDFRHSDGSRCRGGKIYNPRDGRTYSCHLEVLDGGKRLRVRGYVGFSLFGRTEYWTRVDDLAVFSGRISGASITLWARG